MEYNYRGEKKNECKDRIIKRIEYPLANENQLNNYLVIRKYVKIWFGLPFVFVNAKYDIFCVGHEKQC